MFRTLWRTISTEIIAYALVAVVAALLWLAGASPAGRIPLCAAAIVAIVAVWRVRYSRRVH